MLKKLVNVKKLSYLIVVFSVFSLNLLAQDSRNVILNLNENAFQNLRTAIQSENPGLRKSGIYLAGKHSIKEVSETLLEQLKVEADPNLKILIMRVLYILEEEKFIDYIYEVALYDDNYKVRKMATAIYSVMQVENSLNVADRGN